VCTRATRASADITVYINEVRHGQSEIYVTLESSAVGVRIRESFALDMDKVTNYHESLGLLDVKVTMPIHYLPVRACNPVPVNVCMHCRRVIRRHHSLPSTVYCRQQCVPPIVNYPNTDEIEDP
jgi:hypothetical protein